jgi:hypothetical protein
VRYVKSVPVYTLRWVSPNTWSEEKDERFWERAKELMIKRLIQENEETFVDRGQALQRMGELMQEGVKLAVLETQETFINVQV